MDRTKLFKISAVAALCSILTGLLVRMICKNTYKKRLDIMSNIYRHDDDDETEDFGF